MATFRSGQMDLGKSRTYYAAEAGAEYAMAQLAVALEDAVLDEAEIIAPTIPGFSFDSFSVQKVDIVSMEMITEGEYAGLYSLTQNVEIMVEAAAPDYTSSAIMVTAKAQAIPIFQFGVFFEADLEIHNGPPMFFEGWVHSNGNVYLSSNSQYFADQITTPNNVYHDRKDKHSSNTGTYIDDASATNVQLTFDSRDTPDYNAFRSASDASFDNRLKTNAYGVDSLSVPLPQGVSAFEVIQPRETSDGTTLQNAKFSWKADWYIEVDLGGIVSGGSGSAPFSVLITHLQDLIAAHPGPVADKLQDALAKVNVALQKINIPDASAAISELNGARDEVNATPGLPSGLPASESGTLISEIEAVINDINQGGNGQGGGGGGNLCADGMTHTRHAAVS